MASLRSECKIAVRTFGQHWRLVIIIVLTIGTTIGTGTMLLSVAEPVLLKPLPIPDSDRLYRIDARNAKGQRVWISLPSFSDWQDRLPEAHLGGYSVLDFNVYGDEGPEPILGARATERLLDLVDARLVRGRRFEPNEYRTGGPRSVILSHAFWQRRYGGDPTIVGRSIELSGPTFVPDSSGTYQVIGVLTPEFWLFSRRIDLVVPLRPSPDEVGNRRRSEVEIVLAKFDSRITSAAAAEKVAEVVRQLSAQYGTAERAAYASIIQARTAHFQDFRSVLLLALALAGLMFVLALVTVTAALIALAVSRRKEFAVRAALGAPRAALLRQAVVEGVLLASTGGALGFVLALWGTSGLQAVVPAPLLSRLPGQTAAFALEARVVALAAGALLIMAFASAVTTYVCSGGAAPSTPLRDASRGSTETPKYRRLRTGILAFQLCFSVALVVTTSILSSSLVQLQSVDLGMNLDSLVSYWLNLDPRRYEVPAQRSLYFDRVIERVGALPGVEGVTAIDLPANQNWQKATVARQDNAGSGLVEVPEVFFRAVAPNYFDMLGVGIVAGRTFGPADSEGALPVAIVSQTLAKRLWPTTSPVGQQIRPILQDSPEPWLTVVGVAEDVRRVPQEPPTATLYRPLRQKIPTWLYLLVRTQREADITRSVQQAVWAEDPRQPIEGPYVIAEWVREMTAPLRSTVMAGLTFSLLAVLLALGGVYGLTADMSRRAAREIGIRKALGATTADIVRLQVLRCARPALPALLAGGLGGAALLRTIASEFDGVAPFQPSVTVIVVLVFGTLVLIAAYFAAKGAAATSPTVTMRLE